MSGTNVIIAGEGGRVRVGDGQRRNGGGGKQNLDGRSVGPSGGIVAAAPNSCGFKSKLQQVCVCVCVRKSTSLLS